MTSNCPKCGGAMERGFTTASGLLGEVAVDSQQSRLLFVVPGTSTSRNLVKAFKQGLTDGPAETRYRISGARCSACGLLEFYGDGDPVA